MATGIIDFDAWMSERFVALNTDEAVFCPYIKGIVEGSESLEEKIEALDGILSELGDLDVEAFRNEILSKWEQHKKALSGIVNGESTDNLESKLESILKMTDSLNDTQPGKSDEKSSKGQAPDSALRAAILNQCQDGSEDGSADEGPSYSCSGGGGPSSGLERNTNAERVLNEIKDKREREKTDAAKKREKDREDRAKQKQQAQERKDKAKKKAAKVERKR